MRYFSQIRYFMKSNTNFYLREKNKEGNTPINLFVSFDNRRVKIPTGLKIHPKYWNEKKQVAKPNYEHSVEVNSKLNHLEKAITKVVIEYNHLNNEGLKRQFNIELYGDKKKEKKDFHTFVKGFIEAAEKKRTKGTVKSYNAVYNRLKLFETWRKQTITFDDIDATFYDDLEEYSYDVLGHTDNTFGTTIKILKTFLNEATEREHNTNMAFNKKSFKKTQVEVDNIYLNEGELDVLYQFDFSGTPYLERTRDLFLVGCYTGLRFSDFSNIKPENIDGNFIKINTQKVGENVIIPIHPRVKTIMNKYKGINKNSLPKAPNNQEMNRFLKEMGKRAGLDDDVIVYISRRNQKTEVIKKRYELICTHTARRSFATNAYLADIPTLAIMKITGHSTEKNFLKYIKVSQEENALKLMNHPFFKENSTAA